jgi:hypothetical protein
MARNEKGQLAGAGPIPNYAVHHDKHADCNAQPIDLQVVRLTRRCAISAETAVILAPFVFGEVKQR